jgi:acetyltransferase-like isoleucine patch superfamily enzyme
MIKEYGFGDFFKLLVLLIRSKLFYPKARLIRFPFYIKGKKFIRYGRGFTTGRGCRIEAYPQDGRSAAVILGENVQINDYVHISGMSRVSIGNNVLIASKVYISDISHGDYSGGQQDSLPLSLPQERKLVSKEVQIGDCVWIGESVSILPGVTVGQGSIIGANSLVSKDIPAYTIAVGNPARIIKKFDFQKKRWERINNV